MDLPLIYSGPDWDYGTLQRSYDAIERIALDEMGLELYPNRIEVITSEQMLDVYTAHGAAVILRTTAPTASTAEARKRINRFDLS